MCDIRAQGARQITRVLPCSSAPVIVETPGAQVPVRKLGQKAFRRITRREGTSDGRRGLLLGKRGEDELADVERQNELRVRVHGDIAVRVAVLGRSWSTRATT